MTAADDHGQLIDLIDRIDEPEDLIRRARQIGYRLLRKPARRTWGPTIDGQWPLRRAARRGDAAGSVGRHGAWLPSLS